jgi:hypothetical protein
MTPPDGPGAPPPGTPPPPPYPTDPATPGPAAGRPSTPAVAQRKRGRSGLSLLLIGLVIGILLGGTAGYLLFNGNKSVTISNQPQASPSASPSASAAPTATPVPQTFAPATPVTAPQGVVACPAPTPTGQHPLGSPGGPGSGQSRAPGLDFCGGGDATIPTGTTRFMTNNNWGLGIADSCPVGSSGQSGMNTVLTVTEVLPGAGQGPDTATEPGDWVEGGAVLMATGGSYQLRVTTVSPSCVWHITVYPTNS